MTIFVSAATILILQLRHGYDTNDDGDINIGQFPTEQDIELLCNASIVFLFVILYFSIIDNDETPLVLVTRAGWRAKPATGDIPDLITPVPLVIIQHTVQSSCNTMVTHKMINDTEL